MDLRLPGIVQQGRALSYAIKQSVATADAGCSFASDAISCCDRLADVRDPLAGVDGRRRALGAEHPDTLMTMENVLRDMKKIAETAYQGSQDMNNRFKSIRVNLFAAHPTPPPTLPRASDNARTPPPHLDISSECIAPPKNSELK